MLATLLRCPPVRLGLLLIAVALAGCVAYPAAPGPVYAPAYGYYAAPPVSVGVGFGCCWGGYYHPYYHPYWR